MTSFYTFASSAEAALRNIGADVEHQVTASKLLDAALGTLVIGGVMLATRGRLANLLSDFPDATRLLGQHDDTSKTILLNEIDATLTSEAAEKSKEFAVNELALLMTRDREAATAARIASQESGDLTEIHTHISDGTIGRLLFKHAREGAAAFLEKRPGNRYTEYLKTLY